MASKGQITEVDLQRLCNEIEQNPPHILFANNATLEEITDDVAGELLKKVRKQVGATVTSMIDPPAEGQSHSEARVNAIIQVVAYNSNEFLHAGPFIGKLIEALLERRKQAGRQSPK